MLSIAIRVPVRLVKNHFCEEVSAAEVRGADETEMEQLVGRGRAKKGRFEGELAEGELEIGQVSALIKEIKPAADVVKEIYNDYKHDLLELGVGS